MYLYFFGLYGPGNQIFGLRSAIYISRITGRKLIDPIIYAHNKSGNDLTKNYVKFSEIFNLTDEMVKLDDLVLENPEKIFVFSRSLPDHNNVNNHKNLIPEYRLNDLGEYYKIDVKSLISITNKYQDLIDCKDKVIIMANFSDINYDYKLTNNSFKFNNTIESIANAFIEKHFNNKKFIGINIRKLKDDEERFSKFFSFYKFHFEDLYKHCLRCCEELNIPKENIFLSIKPRIIKLFHKDLLLDKVKYFDENLDPIIAQFVEQCICLKSEIYYFCKNSSYSRFVYDLRDCNNCKYICSISDENNNLIFKGRRLL